MTDAYSFGPVLGPMDDYYIREGSHLRLFDKMGAHPLHHEGADGVHFAVWAPNARRVSVVGDFNAWDGRRHSMRLRRDTGIWEIFIPDVRPGLAYKYEIIGPDGARLPLKADPFARASELRPATASIVAPELDHDWGDAAHREFWGQADARRTPISIYEVHPGSWQRDGERFLSWDELADRLIPYVADMGFTHIEFMPISEHPYDPSWGYQTTGLYAPTARFGPPEGFARFVDGAHRAGIGVILDWVPAHFPTDEHGLARFDGTALYEHADPRQGFHPDWNTAIFNFGRQEVFAFLLNNALYWSEKFHVDGLRVDAVASMLYLDYSRKRGRVDPQPVRRPREPRGGRLPAGDEPRRLRQAPRPRHLRRGVRPPGPRSRAPVYDGGLGFGFKWNMGWMHDTLQYMALEPVHRKYHQNDLTFGLLYAFSENFVLPLSHDEVVHGKGSLIGKMAGDAWQKFANLRAYYAFMWGYPGKKLLFMGQEFAQGAEWSEARGLDWWQLDLPAAQGRPGPRPRPQPPLPRHPRAAPARLRGRGLRVAGRRRRRVLRLRLAPQGARPAAGGGRSPTSPPSRAPATACRCRTPAAGARSSTPTPPPTAAPASATWAASPPPTASTASARSSRCRRWRRSGWNYETGSVNAATERATGEG